MINKDFHIGNRHRLVESVSGGLVVLGAYSRMQRGGDASFAFEQESNFWWLTGINEPDWWVIIDGGRGKSWLVSPDVSEIHHTFDGSLSHESASKISGISDIISRDEATKLLRDLAQKHSVVYSLSDPPYAEHYDFTVNPAPKKMWRNLATIFNDVQDCRLEIAKLRAIKQPVEVAAIKKAIKLTVEAFKEIKEKLPNLKYEYEVEAEFTYRFRKKGAAGHAYDPIVASGLSACTLHYCENNKKLQPNKILLMDIGARLDGYAADISRSYIVGRATARQQEVHAAVETAHRQIIKLLRPGLSVVEYYGSVDVIMKKALLELGLISSLDDEDKYRHYFPHAIGHGLGIDVHDSLGRFSEFMPGMVITVEPGIYIPEEAIGVRIEDNILITEKSNINLSTSLPTSL